MNYIKQHIYAHINTNAVRDQGLLSLCIYNILDKGTNSFIEEQLPRMLHSWHTLFVVKITMFLLNMFLCLLCLCF